MSQNKHEEVGDFLIEVDDYQEGCMVVIEDIYGGPMHMTFSEWAAVRDAVERMIAELKTPAPPEAN